MPGFSQPGNGRAPEVRLGALAAGGLAPAIMAIVERGVARRPEKARALGIEAADRSAKPPVSAMGCAEGAIGHGAPTRPGARSGCH